MQKMLLADHCDGVGGVNNETKRSHGIFEKGLVGQLKTEECQHTLMTEPLKASTSVSLTSAGFDFHRPDVVRTVRSPLSPGQLLNEIMASRVRDKCQELVKMPSSRTLDRTAAVSSALLVMQLYASRRSRKVFLTFVQFVSASALSSVACCAIFLRFVQLLDVRWNLVRAISLLHYARPYLLRLTSTGTPQIDSQPARSGPVTVRTAATSVSVVVAALYVLRKLRR
uniref:Uncharacterized protein n=1 Tax=Hyaloperonospora arabidopsidis (strain Emoy2) TaxID=559515 RepID=M4C6R2_HYAAE